MRRSRLRSDTRRKRPEGGEGFSDRRHAISKASEAQREKVALWVVQGGGCVACGKPHREEDPLEPAHICPRAHGGCDDPLCVIPLDHWCHRQLDQPLGRRKLDLLPALLETPGRWTEEIQHALGVGHYNGDLLSLLHRLTADRYVPETVEPVA